MSEVGQVARSKRVRGQFSNLYVSRLRLRFPHTRKTRKCPPPSALARLTHILVDPHPTLPRLCRSPNHPPAHTHPVDPHPTAVLFLVQYYVDHPTTPLLKRQDRPPRPGARGRRARCTMAERASARPSARALATRLGRALRHGQAAHHAPQPGRRLCRSMLTRVVVLCAGLLAAPPQGLDDHGGCDSPGDRPVPGA